MLPCVCPILTLFLAPTPIQDPTGKRMQAGCKSWALPLRREAGLRGSSQIHASAALGWEVRGHRGGWEFTHSERAGRN